MWRAALLMLLLASPGYAAAEHMICFSGDGVFHHERNCQVREGLRSGVEPTGKPRRFFWASRSQHAAGIGVLPAGAASVTEVVDASCCTIAVPPSVISPEGEDATVVLTGTSSGEWTFTLDSWWFREGRLNIRVPRDAYGLRITSESGKVLFDRPGPDFRKSKPAASLLLEGRAVGKDKTTPADFAHITLDCRRVACTADAEGRFRCPIRAPLPRALCVEHPEMGRARIDLEGRSGELHLETLALQPGAAIRVIRPLHVELPAGTKLSLRRGSREIRPPEEIGQRDELDLLGLEPGKYDVVLTGPGPLQRKRFVVELRDRALEELHLSLDAYRLTGHVQYRDSPLTGAKVNLNGELASAELKTDQSGRFDVELWDADSYAVTVQASELRQPWGVMKRASVTDNDWRLVIPSRRIAGRVVDGDSGDGVPKARIGVESTTDDGTRWSRNILAAADGTFEIAGVGEGRYLLTPRQPSFLTPEPVEVVIGKSAGDPRVTLTIERGVEVALLVVDPNGAPLAGATILSDFSPNGERANRVTLTDDAGRAMLALRPRTATTVFVLARTGAFAPLPVTADEKQKEVPVIVPHPAGALNLIALSADEGQPLPGLSVALRYNGQPVPRDVISRLAPATTDAAGHVLLPSLPPGVYEFAFAVPGLQRAPAAWQRVEVGSGTVVVTQRLARR